MIRSLLVVSAAALITTASFSTLSAQETRPPRGGEDSGAPRLTPEERRARWEELRALSPDERRARFLEWRGETARQETEPEGPPPENYLEQLEFRGILALDGVTEYSLRNPWEKRTFLVSEGNPSNGISVVEFDAATNALTLRHGEETRTLDLKAARVAEMEGGRGYWDSEDRRQLWAARRERLQQFRTAWEEAAKDSPELQAIEQQFRELRSDFRENRSLMSTVEQGSSEWEQLRANEQEMRDEFRLLTEYSLLEMRKNPAFENQDLESAEGMIHSMMRRSGGEGDWDGRRWGRGDSR